MIIPFKYPKLAAALLALLTLTACEDDNKNDEQTGSNFSDQEVLSTVKRTNDSYWGELNEYSNGECFATYCLEGQNPVPETPMLTRFREGELIPVYYRDAIDERYIEAMDYMEELAGYQLFDRKGIVTLDISDPDNIDTSAIETDWGMIWSKDTSIGMMSGFCSKGTVSTAPYSWETVSYITDLDFAISDIADDEFSWINIDSKAGANNGEITCTNVAPLDVVIHELGHALGMLYHFEDFGDGDAWGKNARDVFKTMYSRQNPPGQPYDSLVLERSPK